MSVVSLDETDVREIYQFMGDLDSLAVNYASLCPDQKPILRELAGNLAGMDACAPVSYTHLDVYKRQLNTPAQTEYFFQSISSSGSILSTL